MIRLSPGKIRGLQQLANSRGVISVCAIDHRELLKKALNEKNPEAVSHQEMVNFKLDLVSAVAPYTSAVLLDPIYGAGQVITSGVLPGQTGFIISIEKTGYTGGSAGTTTELLPDWSVSKVKKVGASGVKLLVHFRIDLEQAAAKQLALVNRVVQECIKEDIPLIVESLCRPTEEEKDNPEEFSRRKPNLVIEAAGRLTLFPFGILESEFPVDMDYEKDESKLRNYCQQLTQISLIPWVLVSVGTDFERFKREVEIACQSGASGFVAGRVLWAESTLLVSRNERLSFFKNQVVSRLRELMQIADKWATPWYVKMGSKDGHFPALSEGWYRRY